MNQNLTVLFVLRRTLSIIMDANRYIDSEKYAQTTSERYYTHLVQQSGGDREDIDLSLAIGCNFKRLAGLLGSEQRENAIKS